MSAGKKKPTKGSVSRRTKTILRDAESMVEFVGIDEQRGAPPMDAIMRLATGAPGGLLMIELAKLEQRFEEAGKNDAICQAVSVALSMVISTSRISVTGYEYRAQLASLLSTVAREAAFHRLEVLEQRLADAETAK